MWKVMFPKDSSCLWRVSFTDSMSSFKPLVHPDDDQRVTDSIIRQIDVSEDNMDFVKYRIITPEGKIKQVRDYGHLVVDDNDADLYYVFLVEDY